MSFLRSQEMGLYMLSVEKNYSWELMETLGKFSALHFLDSNRSQPIFTRPYANIVRRCDEALKKIVFLETLCAQHAVPLSPPRDLETFTNALHQHLASKGKDSMAYFEEVEQALGDDEKFLKAQRRRAEETAEECEKLLEQQLVYERAREIVSTNVGYRDDEEFDGPGSEKMEIHFTYIAGLIRKEDAMRLKRLIFRKSRGNAMTLIEDVPRGRSGELMQVREQCVYVVIFRGDLLRSSLKVVCETFTKHVYPTMPRLPVT